MKRQLAAFFIGGFIFLALVKSMVLNPNFHWTFVNAGLYILALILLIVLIVYDGIRS